MNKKNKIFITIFALCLCGAIIYFIMGQIAWELLKIEQKAPINAWWLLFSHTSNAANLMALKMLIIPGILIFLLPIIIIAGAVKNKKRWVFGNAKIATLSDIKKAKLILTKKIKTGIFLGFFKNEALYDTQDEHVLLVADTRTGKGVSFLIPSLLTWSESIIVHDPKAELWDITATFRESCGHKIYKFSPFNSEGFTHRFNVFDYIDHKNPINFIQQVSYFLYPIPKSGDPLWSSSARTMFQGLTLYLLETKPSETITFSRVLRLGQMADIAEFLLKEVESKELSDSCKALLEDFAGTTEKTRSGIVRQFLSALDIFQNPLVAAATEASDFDLRDLRKQKISIYISGGSGIADLQRMAFLNRLIFQTASILNTKELPEDNPKELKYKCLLVLDEMFHMGVMRELVDSITLIAGYGIRVLSVFQNEGQIEQLYHRDVMKTFISNHKTRIYFLPDDNDLPELCKKIGFTTIKVASGGFNKGNSYSLQKRELFLPEQLKKKLSNTKSVIFSRGCNPIIAKKAIYHKDKKFMQRIVPENLVNRALKSRSMEELKGFLIDSPIVPKQSIKLESQNIKRETIESQFNQIPTPTGTEVKEMDNFINAHANAFF